MFNETKSRILSKKTILCYLYSIILVGAANAADDWTQQNPSSAPSARQYHDMAYIGGDQVLLFGGDDGSIDDETWVYDLSADTWTKKSPSSAPSARSRHAMAHISDDQVLLFGGYDGSNDDETWVYDLSANTWTNKEEGQNWISGTDKPEVRGDHAMAYIGGGQVLLFGGYDSGTGYNDTWIYDLSANTWAKKSSGEDIPSTRYGHAAAYIGGDQVLLFGGLDGLGYSDETWVYDLSANTWTQKSPAVKPPGRMSQALAYSGCDKVLLFGGSGSITRYDDTWIYDLSANTWTQDSNTSQPSARYAPVLSETSMDGSSYPVLFGGNIGWRDDETWTFGGGDYLTVPILSVSPTSVDFSYVLVGETRTEQVKIKNTGTADLNISSIAISGVDSLNFIVDTTTFILVPDDSLFLDVNFTPDDTGSFSASLDIESDGGDASVALTGNGFEIAGDYTLEFDGMDDWVDIGDVLDNTFTGDVFSICAWINLYDFENTNGQVIVSKIDATGANTDDMFVFQILPGIPGALRFSVADDSDNNYGIVQYTLSDGFLDSEHFVVGVYDRPNTEIRIYIDGILVNSNYADIDIVDEPNVRLVLGTTYGQQYPATWRFFNGTIDEVRIWNVARTQAQIQADMFSHLTGTEEGLVAYYRMDEGEGHTVIDYSSNKNNGQMGSTTSADDNDPTWAETVWPIAIPIISVSPDSIDFSNVLAEKTATRQVTVKNTGTADLNVSSISISGVDSLNFIVDTTTFILVPDDSLFLDVCFTPDDTGSYSASLDIVSNCGNANVALTGKGFEIAGDYALEFDGVDDYVKKSSFDFTGDNLTIALWVKPGSSQKTYAAILDYNHVGTQANWVIQQNSSNINQFYFAWGAEEGFSTTNTINSNLTAGEWQHFVVKKEGTIVTHYVNGVQTASGDGGVSGIINYSTPTDLVIGATAYPASQHVDRYFNGSIDEVRIWNVARTQEEIQADMSHHLNGNEEGLVGYWRMDEGQGQTLVDYSYNGNDGQLGSSSDADDNDPSWLETFWPYGSPELSVSPLSIDFGDVVVGETAAEPVTVSNTGTADLTVSSIAITGDDPENFSVAPVPFTTIPFTLVPGESQILDVGFTPDAIDSLSASLKIDSDGGSEGVALAGNGIVFPVLSVEPLSIDFGAVPDGETVTEQVTVINAGTADLNVSSITISGADSSNFGVDTTSFMLAPGDNKILDIGFTPDEVGSFSASLDIETDGGSVSIDLDGVGVDPKPKIISITDVPDDQGSRVYLEWLASGYDTLGEITQYGIWELNPENKWVSLGNVPAIQLDYYIYLAQTFGDSTVAGILWNKFKVTAHTTDPKKFYTSVVDSGYSVDNLAPEAPTGILAVTGEDNTVALSWDQPVDEDFNHFRIYRSLESEFDPTGTEPLMETTDTDFTDDEVEIGETYYYRLSSVDFSGNESDFSDIASATVVSIDESANLPTEFALSQNYPNPFNPITRINYDLPEATFVTLKIYDMLGREVQTLVNKSQQAGRYSVMFDASKLSSGVYFYKLEAGNFVEMKKMILMR